MLGSMLRAARVKVLECLPEWRLIERLTAYFDHILRQFITDKEHVKLYVKARVGEQFNVPTLLVTNSAEEASAFANNRPMIAKPTHGSSQIQIRAPGETLPRSVAEAWLRMNFYRLSREANYRYLRPKIIFEHFLGENGKPPNDYKIFCFHGEPKFIRVSIDRFGYYTAAMYDTEWNRLAFTIMHRQGPDIPRPSKLERDVLAGSRALQTFRFPSSRSLLLPRGIIRR